MGTSRAFILGKTLAITDDLNGKANTSHTHSASNITSGTLPLSRGGTGVTSISALKSALGISGSSSAKILHATASSQGTSSTARFSESVDAIFGMGYKNGYITTIAVCYTGIDGLVVQLNSDTLYHGECSISGSSVSLGGTSSGTAWHVIGFVF